MDAESVGWFLFWSAPPISFRSVLLPGHFLQTRLEARAACADRLRSKSLRQSRRVENAPSRTQIASVGKQHGHAAEDADFALSAGIPQPFLRAKKSGRVGDCSGIHKRPQLDREKRSLKNVLVE